MSHDLISRTEYNVRFHYLMQKALMPTNLPEITDTGEIRRLVSHGLNNIYKLDFIIVTKLFDTDKVPNHLSSYQEFVFDINNYPGVMLNETKKDISFLVADRIRSIRQLKAELAAKHKINRFSVNGNSDDDAPVIMTSMRPVGDSKDSGKDIKCEVLNSEKDIVIDHKLLQIFPTSTGKMPAMLKEFFGNEK